MLQITLMDYDSPKYTLVPRLSSLENVVNSSPLSVVMVLNSVLKCLESYCASNCDIVTSTPSVVRPGFAIITVNFQRFPRVFPVFFIGFLPTLGCILWSTPTITFRFGRSRQISLYMVVCAQPTVAAIERKECLCW